MRAPLRPPEFRDWTLSDGYVVRGRVWPARGASQAGILYLHGIQSHGGWYEWSASLLAESGQLVLMPDRRGSGLNQAARGDTPSARRWLADLDEHADWARREFGVQQFAVVGVSWGGKLATAWALRRPELVARLLLIVPGIFPAVDLRWTAKLRVALALLAGGKTPFDIPLNDPALFTDAPAGRQFIDADPLKLARVSARFLYESRRLDGVMRRMQSGALSAALTLFLAGNDRIIRNAPTRTWAERVSAQRPVVRVHPTAAHTLEFEDNLDEFERGLREWCSTRAAEPKVSPQAPS